MADRYWVGGNGTWNASLTTNWSATSGGAGGASVPTSVDNVFFNAASGATAVVSVAATANCLSLTCTGFTGTISGTSAINVYGSLTLVAGMTFSNSGTVSFLGTGSQSITSGGKTISGGVTINSSTLTITLSDALSTGGSSFTLTSGTFTTNNFNVTTLFLNSSNSNVRTYNLGSSTVTITGTTNLLNFGTSTNLSFNAGTSTINSTTTTSANYIFAGGGQTFYNVSFTAKAAGAAVWLQGANTFNNLTTSGLSGAGFNSLILYANQIVNGTFTINAGTAGLGRAFVCTDAVGTARTFTIATAAALTDVDFRDISVAGAAAPLSGTRIGDAGGNTNVTASTPKTVYFVGGSGSEFVSNTSWAATAGGASSALNLPLPQDTGVFGNTFPPTAGTCTVNNGINMGSIDMSTRTTSTLSVSASGSFSYNLYGSVSLGNSGVTINVPWVISGAGTQTITSSGGVFRGSYTITKPSGSAVVLNDALLNSGDILTLTQGTFNSNNFNVTIGSFRSNSSNTRILAIGTSTWTLNGTGAAVWSLNPATNMTVSGSGTISMTGATAKTFTGGGVQTYPILNQGGAGALTIVGANGFANITNTYAPTGATTITFPASTKTTFLNFTAAGQATRLLTINSSSTGVRASLVKGSPWTVGVNSVNVSNNNNLYFTADPSGVDYLSIQDINGVSSSSFLSFFMALANNQSN